MPSLLVLDEGGLISEDPIAIVAKGHCLILSLFLLSDHVGLVWFRPDLLYTSLSAMQTFGVVSGAT